MWSLLAYHNVATTHIKSGRSYALSGRCAWPLAEISVSTNGHCCILRCGLNTGRSCKESYKLYGRSANNPFTKRRAQRAQQVSYDVATHGHSQVPCATPAIVVRARPRCMHNDGCNLAVVSTSPSERRPTQSGPRVHTRLNYQNEVGRASAIISKVLHNFTSDNLENMP